MAIIFIGVFIGIIFGVILPITIPSSLTQYVAIGLLASFDTIFGGLCADMDNKFEINVFLSGFFTNAILACFIIFIGNTLGIDLVIAVIVVFGTRLFNNFSKMRQKLLQNHDKKSKIKEINKREQLK